MNETTAIAAIIIGLVLSFFGFKIQKLVIIFAWFVLGFNLGNELLPHVLSDKTIITVISLVIGLLLGSLGYKLEKLALFIAVTYLVFKSVGSYLPSVSDPNLALLIKAGVSLIAGALSVMLIKPILIGVTSIAGVTIIKDYISVFVSLSASTLNIGALILIIIGILYQLKTT